MYGPIGEPVRWHDDMRRVQHSILPAYMTEGITARPRTSSFGKHGDIAKISDFSYCILFTTVTCWRFVNAPA